MEERQRKTSGKKERVKNDSFFFDSKDKLGTYLNFPYIIEIVNYPYKSLLQGSVTTECFPGGEGVNTGHDGFSLRSYIADSQGVAPYSHK